MEEAELAQIAGAAAAEALELAEAIGAALADRPEAVQMAAIAMLVGTYLAGHIDRRGEAETREERERHLRVLTDFAWLMVPIDHDRIHGPHAFDRTH